MKKFLVASAALALIASPVVAQDWQSQTYGQDGAAWWALEASVQNFCALNAGGARVIDETNGEFDESAGSNGRGGTSVEADGLIVFDIQDPTNNTVQEANVTVAYDNSVCNTPFNVTAMSENGGLNWGTWTGDNDFIDTVPYRVNVNFDGASGSTTSTAADGVEAPVITTAQPTAGDFRIRVRVPAQNDLLLQGDYEDFLMVTMKPVTGPYRPI